VFTPKRLDLVIPSSVVQENKNEINSFKTEVLKTFSKGK
jgi:hypothetical protein